jgi:hypothetical protein
LKNKHRLVLLAGDSIVLALVTLFGFARHGEIGSGGLRILWTYLALLVSWFLIAPFLGAYDLQKAADIRQLWRPFYAMVLAGPFAGWLRGVLLGNALVSPVFVLVFGGISALAITGWRALYWLVVFRTR